MPLSILRVKPAHDHTTNYFDTLSYFSCLNLNRDTQRVPEELQVLTLQGEDHIIFSEALFFNACKTPFVLPRTSLPSPWAYFGYTKPSYPFPTFSPFLEPCILIRTNYLFLYHFWTPESS